MTSYPIKTNAGYSCFSVNLKCDLVICVIKSHKIRYCGMNYKTRLLLKKLRINKKEFVTACIICEIVCNKEFS
jgi:hypothetical protein